MIKKIIICIFLICCFFMFSQESKIDLLNYDFFGFKMNYTMEDVKNTLKKQDKTFKISEIPIHKVIKDPLYIIEPKDYDPGDSGKMVILDYTFTFYKNRLSYLYINKFDKPFFDKLLREIGNYTYLKQYYNKSDEIYQTNFFEISFRNNRDGTKGFSITNKKNGLEVWDELIKTEPVLFKEKYFVKNKNAKIYLSPSFSADKWRDLILNEVVYVLEWGENDKVDGIEGKWVKVKTEKGEVGWCFDAYLEEFK